MSLFLYKYDRPSTWTVKMFMDGTPHRYSTFKRWVTMVFMIFLSNICAPSTVWRLRFLCWIRNLTSCSQNNFSQGNEDYKNKNQLPQDSEIPAKAEFNLSNKLARLLRRYTKLYNFQKEYFHQIQSIADNSRLNKNSKVKHISRQEIQLSYRQHVL